MVSREHWGSKIGLILALAGNAIGLGNFLRFPTQAAANGGGAYLIPYFVSLLLLGIPLMWLELAMGRYGGVRGHGSAAGILYSIYPKRISLYIGAIGIFISFIITIYYTYIESWTLSYAIASLIGKTPKPPDTFETTKEFIQPFEQFLLQNIGEENIKQVCIFQSNLCLNVILPSPFFYIVFICAFFMNIYILVKGISAGIEKFALFAMPALFLMAIILVIRVFTLDSPHGTSLPEALGFLWEPKFEGLKSAEVWIRAAGQIFFTLSIGISIIMTYASYIERGKDIALTGLTTTALNEFAEVVLGSSIALIAAVLFFGVNGAIDIAQGGAFRLGFASMPAIFSEIPSGWIFGFIWFSLLFLAGITSSIALASPLISLLEDEFLMKRKKSVVIVGMIWFTLSHIPVFVKGAIDEMDFWAGTIGLVVFALVEVIYFAWILGEEKAYMEIMDGAKIKIPRFIILIMKYISPIYLIALLVFWIYEVVKVGREINTNIIFTRAIMLISLIALIIIIHIAWRKKIRWEMEKEGKT